MYFILLSFFYILLLDTFCLTLPNQIHKNIMKKLFIITIYTLLPLSFTLACTTAVISGKCTKDGRPIIWKLRDTDNFKNDVRYFSDDTYSFVGLFNSNDEKGDNVWGGINEKGFAIMNSASFNVNIKDTTKLKDQEGIFMKKALAKCASLEDLEVLLDTLKKPMGLAAHFGVVDAKGGAAFYEVNNNTFTKFDANTTKKGYVIRTNYSKTGKKDEGYGYIRCSTAEQIFAEAEKKNNLDYQTIIQDFSRCMKHSLLKKDYRAIYEKMPKNEDFINSGDLITRHGSASAVIIKGVKDNDPKYLGTMWTMVGFPNTSIAIPVFPFGKKTPIMLSKNEDKDAPLNRLSLLLKDKCYPIKPSSGYKYLKISKLFNAENKGFVQIIEKAEKSIFQKTEKTLQQWRKKAPSEGDLSDFYDWIDQYTLKIYSEELGVK